jgi:CelD/BcsL family acetyltransferase involved in cellulose biosynthesis
MVSKKIERFSDFDSLQKYSKEWNELLFRSDINSPFLSFDWFYSWWQSFSRGFSLEILVCRDNRGNLCGIAPLMLDNKSLRFIAGREVTDYCDFISTKEHRLFFFEELLTYIKANYRELHDLDLINIRWGSPTLSLLPGLAGKYGFSFHLEEAEPAPVLELPSTYDEYILGLSRKNRHELRRKLRKMYSLEDIRTEKVTDVKRLGSLVDEFIRLHKKSSPEKRNFWEKPGMRDFFSRIVYRFSLKDWVELNILYSRDKIPAALLSFIYADKIYFYNIAYSRAFSKYSPGIYLFNDSIKRAITENKRAVDFLRGREKYKFSFGAKECKIHNLKLTFTG